MAALDFKADARIGDDERSKLRAFCTELGQDIIGLANDLGVKVYEEELWPYQSGYLEYAPTCGSASNFRIVVNAKDAVERKRFTVAHELAHFLLHRRTKDYVFRSEPRHRSQDPFEYLEPTDALKEREANSFAAALLLPQNLFVPAFERLDGNLDLVARLFAVSRPSAERQARQLKLLPK